MERTCKVCNLTKTIEDFYINNKKTLNRKTTCKICDQLERKSRKLKNPDYWRMIETNRKRKWGHLNRNRQFNSRLKYQYGIDSKEYYRMLSEQNDVCAICKNKETRKSSQSADIKKLAVDHCHSTGKVRGLLCFDCNSSIGKMKESKEILQNAITYLEKHK